MPTALILGASRGIGHELARQYLADGWRVLATARQAADLDALTALGADAHTLDVTDGAAIAALCSTLADTAPDAAWLVAGLYGPRSDAVMTDADFDAVMHTNVLAAMRLLPRLAPLLAASGGKLGVLSSRMGSIGERDASNGTLYRASKAALNSVLRDTALRYGPQGVTCIAFHPGWVQTDMGGAGAALTVEQSARDLRATLAAATPAANGSFLNHDGKPIAW
jgi:NAD(P)-dependent dehydrogenase (short-subunit alcohol dehydrogenase family)